MMFASGTLIGLYRFSRGRGLREDQLWLMPMSKCVFAGVVSLLVGGAFIGIAYQPICFTLFGFYLCMIQAKLADPETTYLLEHLDELEPGMDPAEIPHYQPV